MVYGFTIHSSLPQRNSGAGQVRCFFVSLFTFNFSLSSNILLPSSFFNLTGLQTRVFFPTFAIVKKLLTLAIVILAPACEPDTIYVPTETERRVLNAYTALSLLNSSFAPATSTDSIRIYKTMVDSILEHEGLSREEFRIEMESFASTPERFQHLFLEIHNRLQKETAGGK